MNQEMPSSQSNQDISASSISPASQPSLPPHTQSAHQPSSNPPQPIPKKTPNALVLLLVGALLFGAGGFGTVYFLYTLSQNAPIESSTENITPKAQSTPKAESNEEGAAYNRVEQEETLVASNPTLPDASLVPSASVSSLPVEGVKYVTKETLCYTLTIPENNDAGEENNCDQSFRAYITDKEILVGSSITTEHKDFGSLTNMVAFWKETYLSQDDQILEEGTVMVGNKEGYRILVKSTISKVEREETLIYLPNKYEAYGYPLTGFSITTTFSDFDNIHTQKQELARLLSTWQWK